MTAEQMKYEFDVGYDRITNFDAPGYEPKEISTFLTRAQDSLVDEILDASAYDERNKKAMSRLRQVIPLSTFTAGNYPNGYSTNLEIVMSLGLGSFTTGTSFIGRALGEPVQDFRLFFRVGDVVTIDGSCADNNKGDYSVISVIRDGFTVSPQTPVGSDQPSTGPITIVTDAILRVRNERADIAVIAGNFYFGKIDVGGADENKIFDVEVDPIDDDFYSANKSNPYKKPSIEKIWRIDGANMTQSTVLPSVLLKQHEYITDGTFTLTTVHLHIDRSARAIIVPETTAVNYDSDDGTIDGIWFVDFATGLDCQLDDSIHRDIIDMAVKLAYAALQDEKGFQISTLTERQEQQK